MADHDYALLATVEGRIRWEARRRGVRLHESFIDQLATSVVDVLKGTIAERDALRKTLAGVELGYRCTECGAYLPEAHWTGPWDERYLESLADDPDGAPTTPGCHACIHQTETVPVTATFAGRTVRHLKAVPDGS